MSLKNEPKKRLSVAINTTINNGRHYVLTDDVIELVSFPLHVIELIEDPEDAANVLENIKGVCAQVIVGLQNTRKAQMVGDNIDFQDSPSKMLH